MQANARCEPARSGGAGDRFRAAMRRLAATVTIVTTVEDGVPHGMPATAVSSLSAEPPSLLVCVNRSASMHGPTERTRHFCINMLDAGHADLCSDFGAQARAERFTVGDWSEGRHGLPYLPTATAALFCAVDHAVDYGTHTIFIGRIEDIVLADDAEPLIFLGGAMGRFAPLSEASQ